MFTQFYSISIVTEYQITRKIVVRIEYYNRRVSTILMVVFKRKYLDERQNFRFLWSNEANADLVRLPNAQTLIILRLETSNNYQRVKIESSFLKVYSILFYERFCIVCQNFTAHFHDTRVAFQSSAFLFRVFVFLLTYRLCFITHSAK